MALMPRLLSFKPVRTAGECHKTKNSPVKIFDQQENKVPEQKWIQFYEGQLKNRSGSWYFLKEISNKTAIPFKLYCDIWIVCNTVKTHKCDSSLLGRNAKQCNQVKRGKKAFFALNKKKERKKTRHDLI